MKRALFEDEDVEAGIAQAGGCGARPRPAADHHDVGRVLAQPAARADDQAVFDVRVTNAVLGGQVVRDG
jgi:hypothetical protein